MRGPDVRKIRKNRFDKYADYDLDAPFLFSLTSFRSKDWPVLQSAHANNDQQVGKESN